MYKNMYYIAMTKPNDVVRYAAWYPGNSPEEAQDIAKTSHVAFHNKYNKVQLTAQDMTVVECRLVGEYNKVLKKLQNDRS